MWRASRLPTPLSMLLLVLALLGQPALASVAGFAAAAPGASPCAGHAAPALRHAAGTADHPAVHEARHQGPHRSQHGTVPRAGDRGDAAATAVSTDSCHCADGCSPDCPMQDCAAPAATLLPATAKLLAAWAAAEAPRGVGIRPPQAAHRDALIRPPR